MMRVRHEAWAMVTDAWPSTLGDMSLPQWLPGTKHITTVVTSVQMASHYLTSSLLSLLSLSSAVSSDPAAAAAAAALSEEEGEGWGSGEKECYDVLWLLGGREQLVAAYYSHARTLLVLLALLVAATLLLAAAIMLYSHRFPPAIPGLPCIPDDRYTHTYIYIYIHIYTYTH